MKSRLCTVSRGAAAFLVLFAAWGALTYGGLRPFALVVVLGAIIAALQPGIRRWKLWVRRWRQRSRVQLWDYESYTSEEPARDREKLVERLHHELDAREEFDPRIDDFPEGRGLTVVHTGSHNLFVRFTDADRVVITGEPKRLSALVSAVDSISGLSFEPTDSNPMLQLPRLSNGTRLVVYLIIAFLLVTSVNVGTGAAYSADTYNSAERTFLVGLDARGDVDPTMSSTEVRLSKAAFLIDVLDEEAIEIHWERNTTTAMIRHARQAVNIAEDARALLEKIEAESLGPAEARQVRQLRRNLRSAETNVSQAITKQIQRVDMAEHDAERLRSFRRGLQDSANATSVDDPLSANAASSETRSAPLDQRRVVDEITVQGFRTDTLAWPASSASLKPLRLGCTHAETTTPRFEV